MFGPSLSLIRVLALLCAAPVNASPEAVQAPAVGISASTPIDNTRFKVEPLYPPAARAAHISGAVLLHAIISNTGDVIKLDVISGPPLLREAALNAVRQWKYNPYIRDGKTIAVDTTVTVNFNLSTAKH